MCEAGQKPATSYMELEAKLAAAERRAEEAEALARDLRGAMDADDNRLRAASERVFGDYAFGCDTAMWLADEVLGLRERIAAERAAREKVEAMLNGGMRDRMYAAESRLSCATEALRGAEAHHDEQARLWADNEGDGEADLNAQYHSERRDVFTAVLAEVARG